MQIGVVFPQTEIEYGQGAVATYAREVEAMGFSHLLVYDHVLGADPAQHPNWQGPYDVRSTFHEPLVLFGHLSAVTTALELVTGVLILPQRQTVLVAKQAAEVDILSRGRLRLGVGLGWNEVEYRALGQDFETRGRRVSDQVRLLRRLWTEPSLSHAGPTEQVLGAGLAPLPLQRPIPIWFGAASEMALRRAGRLGDGWFPQAQPGPALERAKGWVGAGALAAGSDRKEMGMEGRLGVGSETGPKLQELSAGWEAAGASHLAINTMGRGLSLVAEHLAVLERVAAALELRPGPATGG
ncbi:MAG: LLM class F420-dependent oxidoreductase [Candidatus Dormibacteria bacterium]